MTDKNLYNCLKERGLLYQCTDEKRLQEILESGEPITLYEGSDPTADSLHIGHCVPYCILRRFQKAGHKVILLMGGATACIGDPSGKNEMRKIMDKETIAQNIEKIKDSLKIFLDFDGENPAIIVNNADWFENLNYVDFMREVGVHFNISKMLSNEIYANRIKEGGLTLFELGYMPMQAYDFIHLNKKYGCTLQYGGGDQWGNIVAGVELARKLNYKEGTTNKSLEGFTNPLLTNYEGKKMGKTEKGALWVDAKKTTPYEFYQYFYNVDDKDVEKVMKLLTRLSLDEIKNYLSGDIRVAKKVMAYEITKLVHGKLEADKVLETVNNIFNNANFENMPSIELNITGDVNVIDLLVDAKQFSSRSEARRMIEQGGITIDDEKVTDFKQILPKKSEYIIKKGKKTYLKVINKN